MLRVENVDAGYGDIQVLWDVSFEVKAQEFVVLVGANGAGLPGEAVSHWGGAGTPRATRGVMDPGEDPEVTAHRELQEEIGKDCGELIRLGGFYMAAGYSSEYMHVFLALKLKDSHLDHDDDEFLTTVVVPISELMEMAQDGRLEDGKSLSTLLLARQELELRRLL